MSHNATSSAAYVSRRYFLPVLFVFGIIGAARVSRAGFAVDLITKSITASRYTAKDGEQVEVTVAVLNQSDLECLNTTVSLYVLDYYTEDPPSEIVPKQVGSVSKDDFADSCHETGLFEAGQTKSFVFPVTCSLESRNWRTLYVWAKVDAENYVHENDEMNNLLGPLEIHVSVDPNVTKKVKVLKPTRQDTLTPGESVSLDLELEYSRGEGAGTANMDTIWIALDVDGDGVFDTEDVMLSAAAGEPTNFDEENKTSVYDLKDIQLALPSGLPSSEDARLVVLDSNNLASDQVLARGPAIRLGPAGTQPANDIFRNARRLGVGPQPDGPEPFDPNDGYSDTIQLTSVSSDRDPDWYKVFITKPGTLTVTLDGAGLVLGLYSQDGQVLSTSTGGSAQQVISKPVFPQDGQWYYACVSAPWGTSQDAPDSSAYPATYDLRLDYQDKYVHIIGPVGGLTMKGSDIVIIQWQTYNMSDFERFNILFTDHEGNTVTGQLRSFSNIEPTWDLSFENFYRNMFEPSEIDATGAITGQLIAADLDLPTTTTYSDLSSQQKGSQVDSFDYANRTVQITTLLQNKLLGEKFGNIDLDDGFLSSENPPGSGLREYSLPWSIPPDVNLWPEMGYFTIVSASDQTLTDRSQSPVYIYNAEGDDDRMFPLQHSFHAADPTIEQVDDQPQSMVSVRMLSPGNWEKVDIDSSYKVAVLTDGGSSHGMGFTVNDFLPPVSSGINASPAGLKNWTWSNPGATFFSTNNITWAQLYLTHNLDVYDTKNVFLVETPDLLISNVQLSDNTLTLNDEVDVRISFKNEGNLRTNQEFLIRVYLHSDQQPEDDTGIPAELIYNSRFTGRLDPGEDTIMVFTIPTWKYKSSGTKKIWVQIDPENDVQENNEDNNFYGPTDLVISGGGKIVMDNPPSKASGDNYWRIDQNHELRWYGYGPVLEDPGRTVRIELTYMPRGGSTQVTQILDLAASALTNGSSGTFNMSATLLQSLLVTTSEDVALITLYSTYDESIFATGVIDRLVGTDQRDDPFEPNDDTSEATDLTAPLSSSTTGGLTTTVTGTLNSASGLTITNLDKLTNDYYSIPLGLGKTIVNGGLLEANITFDHDANDLDLELYDSAGHLLAYSRKSQDGGGTQQETILHYLEPSLSPYYIRVYGDPTFDSGTTEVYDLWAKFTEHTITLQTQADGEVGQPLGVTWTNYGNNSPATVGTNVRIELSTDGDSQTWETVLDPNFDNSLSATVTFTFSPQAGLETNNAQVRVTDLTTSSVAVSNVFAIGSTSNQYVVLTTPQPGETLRVAETYELKWETNVSGGLANIYFSDNGVPSSWTRDYLIAQETENDEIYALHVPNEVTENAVLHIELLDILGNPIGVSNTMAGTFKITPYDPRPKISVVTDPAEIVFVAYEGGIVLNGHVTGYPVPAIRVSNGGSDLLNFTAAATSQVPGESYGWLNTPSPNYGSNLDVGSVTMTLSVNTDAIRNMSAGNYYGQVTISDPAAVNDPQTVSVRLEIRSSTIEVRNPSTDQRVTRLPETSGAYLVALTDTVVPVTDTVNLYNYSTAFTADVSSSVGIYYAVDVSTTISADDPVNLPDIDKLLVLSWTNASVLPLGSVPLSFEIHRQDAGLTLSTTYYASVTFFDSTSGSYAGLKLYFRVLPPEGNIETTPLLMDFTGNNGGTNLQRPADQTFTFSNNGSAAADWTMAVSAPWITLSLTTLSTTSATINGYTGSLQPKSVIQGTVSIDTMNSTFFPTPGIYTGNITITNTSVAGNPEVTVTVQVEVSEIFPNFTRSQGSSCLMPPQLSSGNPASSAALLAALAILSASWRKRRLLRRRIR